MDLLREIGSNLSKQRALLADAKKDLQRIQTIQSALQETLHDIWSSTQLKPLTQSKLQWKAFVDLVASGRVLSVAAQADDVLLLASSGVGERVWIGDGKQYAQWLGDGVAKLAKDCDAKGETQQWTSVVELCGRSFNLGYTDELVASILRALVLEQPRHTAHLQRLVQRLKAHEQRRFVHSTIAFVSKRCVSSRATSSPLEDNPSSSLVSAYAALLDTVVLANEEQMGEHLSTWLAQAPNASLNLYRCVITALPREEHEKSLNQVWHKFCDQLFVKHAPITQQDDVARILLLLAGTVYRQTPMAVFVLAHSTIHTSGVSFRLSSPSPRARFLGMAVGSAISQLVDRPESRMNFAFEGDDKESYDDLNALLKADDRVGTLDDLSALQASEKPGSQATARRPKGTIQAKAKLAKPIAKIQVLDEDSEDDIVPYAKPDSDPEDSDEDPSIARRTKPRAPVYIRDLITQLGNEDDAEVQQLALITAPSLLRRKADFGTELADRAVELCATFLSLSDPFNLEDFLHLRLQGMIALLVAQPKICGPYIANAIFDGEYNISQRVGALTAMGLAARELAGYSPDDAKNAEKQFPSKTLPERLHKLYLQDSELSRLSTQLSTSMLNPVTTTRHSRPTRTIIRNPLHTLIADSFFFPLTGRFASHARSLPSLPKVLPTFVQTLSIMLGAGGPATLALPQLTTEMFALLLSLRTRAMGDSAVLEAVMFGLLSVLNVNEDKRALAERHAREVVEVHRWCDGVFERLSGGMSGVSEEEERVKTLCAGVLVATKEVVEAYERVMVGELVELGGR